MMQEIISKNDWLSLISVSGLMISEPVIESEFPDGLSTFAEWKYMKFKKESIRFEINHKKDQSGSIRNWLDFVLEDFLEIENTYWKKHNEIPKDLIVDLVEYNQTLKPNRVLLNESKTPVLLVMNYPIEQSLDKQENKTGKWKASPFVKIDRLLRETNINLGIVTNGHDFRLVYAAPGLSTSYLTWDSQGWYDEKITLESFYSLLSKKRIFGIKTRQLLDLIEESQKRQVDVANQLGGQVRDAIEIFIKALDKANKSSNKKLFEQTIGDEIYHMTLTVMMRVVFLLYAEENYLLPHGQMMYDKSYGISYLLGRLQQNFKINENSLNENFDAWNQILATFRLVHDGSSHPDLLLDGYGGDLFDSKKFSVLEDSRLKISNKDVMEILLKLTFAQSKLGKTKIAQRLSYRSLDVEQIGSIYENLFDFTVKNAEEILLVLQGKEGNIIRLSELQEISVSKQIDYLSELTGKTKQKLKTIFDNDKDDSDLVQKISEVILDVIEKDQLYLTQKKGERKGSGSFYTPKEVTSFLVRKVLENLVYDKTGPNPIIKTPKEILDLRICDPSMGSGAFLVQSCRYLAERLVESWDLRMLRDSDKTLTCPYAEPAQGRIDELYIPDDRESALVLAKRFVAERCLYGVDLNPLSVELAKMSLWLTTMAKNKPFSFLDHHLKSGNSLVGCHTSLIQKYPFDSWMRDSIIDQTKNLLEIKKQIKIQKKNSEKGQSLLFNLDETILKEVHNAISKLEDIEKISIFEPEKKEKLYLDYLDGVDLKNIKNMFNAWTALWFWPRDDDTLELMPMPDSYFEFLKSQKHDETNSKSKSWKKIVSTLASKFGFFNWELEFPRIFFKKNPGFDVLIGNPPWDKVKFEEHHFFELFSPNYKKTSSSEQTKIRSSLLKKKRVLEQFEHEKEFSFCMNNFADSVLNYNFQSDEVNGQIRGGDKNLYKLFVEKFFNITRDQGDFGVILPASFNTDETSTGLRRLLLKECGPNGIWSFYKRAKIFPIDQAVVITTFEKTINEKQFVSINNIGFDTPGNIPEILLELETRTSNAPKISKNLISELSPELKIFQSINSKDDFEILKKLFSFPILRKDISGMWNVDTTSEIHLTKSKPWFKNSDTGIFLWRGNNIQRYLITQEPTEWLDQTCPYYKKEHSKFARLCWGTIHSHQDIRRMAFTILPSGGALGNSISYFKPQKDPTLFLYLCGILNSYLMEYRIRQTALSSNILNYNVKDLPVPRLLNDDKIRVQIVLRVLKLVGNVFGKYDGLPDSLKNIEKVTDPVERLQIECEIEAFVGHAYGFEKSLFSSLLEKIPLPRGFDPNWRELEKRHLVLKKYDELKTLLDLYENYKT